jgi:hypothetical protein
MAGLLTSVVLAGLLTASPEAFTFDGPQVSARTLGTVGFFTQGATPFSDLFERGRGSAELSVQDRVADPRATYGDVGRLEARFSLGASEYQVELLQAGFPPQASALTPQQPMAGGVMLDQALHGGSGLGFPSTTQVQAAAAVWGVGRVWRNGQLLTDSAVIHAAALSRGAHADDDTFRLLAVSRRNDLELYVLVWNLPPAAEPRGFLQFAFDDVAIEVNGSALPAVAAVPTAGAPDGVDVPATSVPASLSGASNTGVGGSGFTSRVRENPGSVDFDLPGGRVGTENTLSPFLNPDRVSLTQGAAQQGDTQGMSMTPVAPEVFLSPAGGAGRVALSVEQPGQGNAGAVTGTTLAPPPPPDLFFGEGRVTIANELPPPVGGLAQQGQLLQQPASLSTTGSFSVVPGGLGADSVFGGARVASGVVATPAPQNAQTPAVPLIATPRPLNGTPPVPLVASPPPLTGAAAVPLISTPAPLSAQPISGTAPAAPTGTVASPAVPAPGAAPAP